MYILEQHLRFLRTNLSENLLKDFEQDIINCIYLHNHYVQDIEDIESFLSFYFDEQLKNREDLDTETKRKIYAFKEEMFRGKKSKE